MTTADLRRITAPAGCPDLSHMRRLLGEVLEAAGVDDRQAIPTVMQVVAQVAERAPEGAQLTLSTHVQRKVLRVSIGVEGQIREPVTLRFARTDHHSDAVPAQEQLIEAPAW